MLVQFVASFGHIHPEQFDALYSSHGVPVFTDHHGPSRAIGDPATADLDCPVCAAMQLLGSSALPEGIRLVPPLSHGLAQPTSIVRFWLTATPHLLFETRGPPHR